MRAGPLAAVAVVAIVAAAAVWMYVPRSAGQESGGPAAYRAARVADGRPDLNGVWQALNTANFDLQAHAAHPALSLLPAPARSGVPGLVRATPVELPAPAVRPLGAVGGVPAGEGVVVGGEIPYQPWAAAKKQENAKDWLARDPEIKCFMPGVPRATHLPYPFQILQGTMKLVLTYDFAVAMRT